MGDFCGTSHAAAAAGYAVKGFLGTLFVFASLCISDVLHYIKVLGTGVSTGITADTAVDFGIKLHHYLFCGLCFLNVIGSLICGEEGNGCYIHTVLYLLLTGKTGLKGIVALDSVNGGTGTAEAVTAAAASRESVARIFHSSHNGHFARYFILFAEKIYIY